jgi:hypothetical protein
MSPRRARMNGRRTSLRPIALRSTAILTIACGTLDAAAKFSSRDTRLSLEERDANDTADNPGRTDSGSVADVAVFRWMGVLSERGIGTSPTNRIDIGRAR